MIEIGGISRMGDEKMPINFCRSQNMFMLYFLIGTKNERDLMAREKFFFALKLCKLLFPLIKAI
jgi:hypothetical protein